jgi:Bacteriophage tail sheath protein
MTPTGAPPTPPMTRGRMTGRAPASGVLNAPGVSVEWVGPLFREIEALRSDVAGFVGLATRGSVDHPRRLENASEFDHEYGPPPDGGFLAAAVHGFFANGGTTCWVMRAVDREAAAVATATLATSPGISFEASSEGTWANEMTVDLLPAGGGRVTVTVVAPDQRRELWRNLDLQGLRDHLSADSGSAKSASALVRVVLDGNPSLPTTASRATLDGGRDGLETLTAAQLTGDETAGFAKAHGAALLADIEEIGMVAIPDLVLRDAPPAPPTPTRPVAPCPGLRTPAAAGAAPPAMPAAGPVALPTFGKDDLTAAMAQLVGDCEALRRTAILQHPDPGALVDDVVAWRNVNFNSAYAAVYWPWLRTIDPARPSRVLAVPPCGHVAGIVARSDHAAGPHKPPANELVAGAVGLTRSVDDEHHGRANGAGVNVIRPVAGRGIRVLGARTVSNERPWRYLNVRRLMTAIERSVAAYASWVVFEPDDQALRDDLERVIRQFLDDLWRAGGLEGRTADEAYQVTVEAAAQAAAGGEGRLVVEIGVQPPWPAEFVVVRIDVTELGVGGADRGGVRGGDDG